MKHLDANLQWTTEKAQLMQALVTLMTLCQENQIQVPGIAAQVASGLAGVALRTSVAPVCPSTTTTPVEPQVVPSAGGAAQPDDEDLPPGAHVLGPYFVVGKTYLIKHV